MPRVLVSLELLAIILVTALKIGRLIIALIMMLAFKSIITLITTRSGDSAPYSIFRNDVKALRHAFLPEESGFHDEMRIVLAGRCRSPDHQMLCPGGKFHIGLPHGFKGTWFKIVLVYETLVTTCVRRIACIHMGKMGKKHGSTLIRLWVH